MPKIVGLHIIPNPDSGCTHKPSSDCECGPSKDSSVNPKVPIYRHNTVGVGDDRFKINVESDAEA